MEKRSRKEVEEALKNVVTKNIEKMATRILEEKSRKRVINTLNATPLPRDFPFGASPVLTARMGPRDG
ncbi:hypothetical protein WN48_10712 [Eufriesea mexicana]|uniref:Uncharacterized protein n=1 Tax=Eufriesea mexicana TaxID=516756 RepID=A0A310SI26_9HYME|nr:hypothetical protein WN48_10712 [Eufriesea mexicana]